MSGPQTFLDGRVSLFSGDCREALKAIPDGSIDACVSDPPYALVSIVKRFGAAGAAATKDGDVYARSSAGFMGKRWDTGEVAFDPAFWAEALRVLKPGGHVVVMSGTRTYHRLACAIEDAGFEIRDQLAWAYGTGFPKSHDVAKGIDKAAGATRDVIGEKRAGLGRKARAGGEMSGGEQSFEHLRRADITTAATPEAAAWEGWGTALKPAWEPIVLARKPFDGTVAANVLLHGTGALNICGCRIGDGETRESSTGGMSGKANPVLGNFNGPAAQAVRTTLGRWPANIVHDGSDEVMAAFPDSDGANGTVTAAEPSTGDRFVLSGLAGAHEPRLPRGDSGSAARFFYSAKADADDRLGSKHPTVKPVDLMRWLCRLVTPPGGVVLDPFAGTGTTGEAAFREGFRAVLCEREAEYLTDIARRMDLVVAGPATRRAASAKARGRTGKASPLFDFAGGAQT